MRTLEPCPPGRFLVGVRAGSVATERHRDFGGVEITAGVVVVTHPTVDLAVDLPLPRHLEGDDDRVLDVLDHMAARKQPVDELGLMPILDEHDPGLLPHTLSFCRYVPARGFLSSSTCSTRGEGRSVWIYPPRVLAVIRTGVKNGPASC